MEIFKVKDEYIQLNQLLKALGWCENGADANLAIENRQVKVNGEIELRKRNKIIPGSTVEFRNKRVTIE